MPAASACPLIATVVPTPWALVLTTAILCPPCGGMGQSSAATQPAEFREILHRAVRSGVPGIQAYVTVGSRMWSDVAGVADVETGRAMAASDRVRVASLTKMMTYAATMELVRQERVRLNDRVVDLLPRGAIDGVPYAGEITIAHLLDHTSGLHNYNGSDGRDFFVRLFSDTLRGTRLWAPEELVAFAAAREHSPTGRPGERRSYSSTGYSLLQMVLEHRLQRPFARIVRETVFEPLRMTSSGVEGHDLEASNIVDSYARPGPTDAGDATPFRGRTAVRQDGLMNLSRGLAHYNAWPGAGGAVATNAGDLARFMAAIRSGRMVVLRDQEREFAEARRKPNANFGWNGGSWGVQGSILYEPGREITVIVLTNASNAGPGSLEIAKELLVAARASMATTR